MSTSPTAEISVYGAGSWGTALAIQLARCGHRVSLWGRETDQLEAMARERVNRFYLPDAPFPDALIVQPSLEQAVASSSHHLIVIPTAGVRGFLKTLQPMLDRDAGVIWASKGIEMGTGKLLHEVVTDVLGNQARYAVVSGPTFAREVAAGLPTAMTLAASEPAFAEALIPVFHGGNMRVYRSDDVIGVELGGAVKNVLAIAAGISDGLGFGANARAALITRGLAEIIRLGEKMGAQRETLMGLAGLGDLVLTCTDNQSRNRRYGLALGQGKTSEQALDEIKQVVEGYKTAGVVIQLAKQQDIEMPICQEVYRVLYEGLPPKQAVSDLLSRSIKAEF
ncbi:MAG TPA: NAD(P)-dependent glycerol-3-phosphate dehydrogenase [Gammaproteobacteria bacterium]|nr:NAD(P)-dependent glycerol-3-phosphate dehydrogenase [Gammaproteobacteria bacterium]